MANKAKVMVRPTSTICIPVGASPSGAGSADGANCTIVAILKAAGLCSDAGVLNSNIESFRLVGGEFRMASNPSTSAAGQTVAVKYAGGQTFELMDPYHSVKLKVSDRNPLGFWKTDTAGVAYTAYGNVDCVSFTIAVRYRQVSFQ
jgi:hypothetical protein